MAEKDFHRSEVFDTGVRKRSTERDRTDDEVLVGRMIEEALRWREENLDPLLEKATKFYNGDPFGDEQVGRSKVVTTEVRDVVQAILPSLLRVFTSSENVVEFKPYGPEDVEVARQQTDYVNFIIQEDNPGFLTLYALLKDALIRKMGIVKWWWDEREQVKGSEHTGLTPEQVEVLEEDDDVDVKVIEENDDGTVDVAIKRTHTKGRVRIREVPPEEFIFSPSARSLEDAKIVGQVREAQEDELRGLGVPKEMIERARGVRHHDMALDRARRVDGAYRDRDHDEQDRATRPVVFAEVFVKLDSDEDGLAELRKVQMVGKEIFTNEVVDSLPFALFLPDPEPHTVVGQSLADYLLDIQRIKSHITRGVLDSLTLTLNPEKEAVESQVNMSDLLNPEVGRIVRVKQPGMIRDILTPFVGGEALPLLQYLDSVKEDRTGISKAASGLDPDALQSATKAAVTATVSAAQQRTELFARIFAETGMKDLMKGVLRLVVQHQDEPRVVRLRNNFVRVDPRSWEADKDVVINVALGTGLAEEKIQMLTLIADKQEQLLQQGVPLTTFAQLRATYARIAELAGFRNSNEFFQPFGEQEQARFNQAQAEASQNEPPNEVEALLQIENGKIQARLQEKQMDIQLKIAQLELEREKVIRGLVIKEAEVANDTAEVANKIDQDSIQNALDAARLDIEDSTKTLDALRTLAQTPIGDV